MSAREYDFKIDDNIIYSIIQKQAGTLEKAFLELIMNSIDAGAKKVDISFDGHRFEIADDGEGFENEDVIHSFFGTFGTPHEEDDAVYGKFRMGRGQIMAFSQNSWHSNTFSMDVDVKNNGTKYNFRSNNIFYNGCKITGILYDELEPYEIRNFTDELKIFIKFSQIPIFFNGELISENINDVKWSVITDEAYIKVDESQNLNVYNLGVKVRDYSKYKMGFGGIIVSKKQLDVNFARNDVLIKSCPVWKKIKSNISSILIDFGKKSIKQNTDLDDEQKAVMSKQFITGELEYSTARRLKLFEDISGKSFTLPKIMKEKSIAVAEKNNRLGDKVHIRKFAFVLNKSVLENFGCKSLSELFEKLKNIIHDNVGYMADKFKGDYDSIFTERALYEDIEMFSESIKTSQTIMQEKELSTRQQLALSVLNKYEGKIRHLVNKFSTPSVSKRKIVAGKSEIADGWTDGKTYIAIEGELLKLAQKGTDGFTSLSMILVHEYIHRSSDTKTHSHNAVFYEIFHSVTMHNRYWNIRNLGSIVHSMTKTYFLELEKNQIKVPQTAMALSARAYNKLFKS